MTPRKADTSVRLDCTIDQVHVRDVLLGRSQGERFLVEDYKRVNLRRTVTTMELTTLVTRTYTLDMNHLVRVQVEHECECHGTGLWSWGGSVNGVPVNTGTHFRCGGKGWQSRTDVLRNYNYDNFGSRYTA